MVTGAARDEDLRVPDSPVAASQEPGGGIDTWKVRLEEEKHDPNEKTEPRGLTSANS